MIRLGIAPHIEFPKVYAGVAVGPAQSGRTPIGTGNTQYPINTSITRR
jgi:hypothetical protein